MEVSVRKVLVSIVREEIFRSIAAYGMLTQDQVQVVYNNITHHVISNKMLVDYILERPSNKIQVIESVTLILEPLLRLVYSTDRKKIRQGVNSSLQDKLPNTLEDVCYLTNRCRKCGERIGREHKICGICKAAKGTDFRKGYVIGGNKNTLEDDILIVLAYVGRGDHIDVSQIEYDECNTILLSQIEGCKTYT